ncbi:MAG: efflux RND transporter periplasmic adaptor subunit [Bacteroidetes bacterium]|nr:efflux RND transporter periplasmic adaptor subunit [Bacteroidota bacterium]
MIQYDTADFESIRNELKVTGEIDYNENNVVKIFPFSSGQVIQVLVSQGEMVTSGQTLAIIRSAEVAGNYQDLSSAFNDLAIAKKQYENSNSLFNNGISSEREYLESKENYNKALAIVEKIRGSIDINGKGNTTSNGTYVIKAPKSGYIIEKKIFEGGYIRSDNTDYLFVIGDIRDVWVWANIYETDIAKIHEGDTALVSTLAYDGQVFKGVVDKMNQQLDPISKVLKIRIRLANDSVLLKPEMFASITVSSHSRQKALCISDQCLIFENGKVYVVVYHDNTNVEVKQVEVLYSSYGKAYIKSGLSEGERIISKFQLLLFDELTDN